MGTAAVHRALARFAQAELGRDVGVANDVRFENFDWPTVRAREGLEAIGIGYGREGFGAGRFYDYPGDPLATGHRNARRPRDARLIMCAGDASLPSCPAAARTQARGLPAPAIADRFRADTSDAGSDRSRADQPAAERIA